MKWEEIDWVSDSLGVIVSHWVSRWLTMCQSRRLRTLLSHPSWAWTGTVYRQWEESWIGDRLVAVHTRMMCAHPSSEDFSFFLPFLTVDGLLSVWFSVLFSSSQGNVGGATESSGLVQDSLDVCGRFSRGLAGGCAGKWYHQTIITCSSILCDRTL